MPVLASALPRALLGAALCALCLAGAARAQNPADADVVAAKAAFDRGDARALARVAPRTGGHVLAPYVEAWQLTLALDSVEGSVVDAFLKRYPDAPFADRLQADWMKALARRGDWAAFATQWPPRAGPDTELRCDDIAYRRQREGDAVLAEAKPLWFTGQSTPDACEPLFAALIGSGALARDDRIARLRLAAEASNLRLVRALGDALPGNARVKPAEFVAIDGNPQHALARGSFAWATPSGQVQALYALERAGRADADAAHAAWLKWRGKLPAEARDYGNLRIAYLGARALEPEASRWFAEALVSRQDAELRAWHVRAALRAQDWPEVRRALDALPPEAAAEPAWRYWRARALMRQGQADEASVLYDSLAGDHGYYGILAAEALGRRPRLDSAPVQTTDIWLADFGARADVRRAVKLAELGMRPESIREWAVIVRSMDDATLLQAAEFARRAGLFDRSINTADRTRERHDFALRYPMPYADQFRDAAAATGVEPSLLLGVARQESRFIADIVSSAGAMGLMQLMPPTARWVSKQLNRSDYRASAITDAGINAQFGAFYLKYWLDRLDGQPALAAAAYNAGPRRADQWRPSQPLEGAIWVETIPFNETRDYVKKVLANTTIYAAALAKPGAPYVSLTTRLGTITPRGATSLAQGS